MKRLTWDMITPETVDKVWKENLVSGNMYTEMAALKATFGSDCVKTWTATVLSGLVDDPISMVMSALAGAIRLGWYIRNDQEMASEMDRMMTDSEMARLRLEIDQEAGKSRGPFLMGPVVPPLATGTESKVE